MAAPEPSSSAVEPSGRAAAEATLRHAYFAAQLAPPSDDPEAAVQALWINLESLLVDHLLPPGPDDRAREPVPAATWWRRVVATAITHAFVLGGSFLKPEDALAATEARLQRSGEGRLWRTRRPPGHGALVLGVHAALLRLDDTASAGRPPTAPDAAAVLDVVALGTVGAVLAEAVAPAPGAGDDGVGDDGRPARRPRWATDPARVAAAFGVPDVQLVAVTRDGWVCDECGCVFVGRVEAGVAYPDRLAPVGRQGPCDATTDCGCHAAPLQRRVR